VIHVWLVPQDALTHQHPTHLRINSLFFGALLCYRRARDSRQPLRASGTSASSCCDGAQVEYGALLLAILRIPLKAERAGVCCSLELFSYIGRDSYFHASIGIGIQLSRMIETPALYMRDHTFPPTTISPSA
jgi:hypothetical protein